MNFSFLSFYNHVDLKSSESQISLKCKTIENYRNKKIIE